MQYVRLVRNTIVLAAFLHEYLFTVYGQDFSEPLAKHFAHLFIRDPLVVYSELLHQDNMKSTDHFEVCILLCLFI